MPPLASASEAKLLRKATGSLTPLVSASGTGLSAALPDVEEVIGDVKIVTTSGSEPAPVQLKNHPPIVNAQTPASDEFDGRPTRHIRLLIGLRPSLNERGLGSRRYL